MLRFTLTNSIEGSIVLTEDPIGWDTGEISLIRSPKYHGVNYSRTLSLQFLCGSGKEYLDNIYDTQGIDASVDVLVETSCDCIVNNGTGDYNNDYNNDYLIVKDRFDGCTFEEFFTGVINFKEYYKTEQITDVSIIESSYSQTFLSRVDTKIDLFGIDSIDGEEFGNITVEHDITLHSKALTYTADFEIINEYDQKTFSDVIDTMYCEIPLYIESSEGFTKLIEPSLPFINDTGNSAAGDINYIWKNETGEAQDIELEIDVIGGIQVTGGGNIPSTAVRSTSLQVKVGSSFDTGTIYFIKPVFNHTYTNSYTTVPLTSDLIQTVTVPAGGFLYVVFVIANIPTDGTTPFAWAIQTAFSKFQVKFKNINTTASSEAKGALIYEGFSRVLQGILSSEDPLRSQYYGRTNASPYQEPSNGDGCFACIMDGFRIRQYPLTGDLKRTPSFSFNDLFDFFNVVDGIGVGFENDNGTKRVRIERKPFFYSNEKSLTLLKVPNVKISVATEHYFNDIEVGFNNWESSGINGLDEYCSKSQYSNGMKVMLVRI
jgi:hypothetical protein